MSDDMNFAALLDSTLDDLADSPEFKLFPVGAYIVTIESAEPKKMGENPGVEFKFACQEVVELAEPTEEAPAQGATTSIGFLLNNEFGQGAFKEVLKSLKEGLSIPDGATNREILEQAKGITCLAVFAVRADKHDKEKKYQSLKSLTVL